MNRPEPDSSAADGWIGTGRAGDGVIHPGVADDGNEAEGWIGTGRSAEGIIYPWYAPVDPLPPGDSFF